MMNNANFLSLAFLEHQPKAAASILQEFPAEQLVDFYKQTPIALLVPVVEHMASWPAARALSLLPEKMSANILRNLPANEAETLLRLMANEQRGAVLKHMPDAIAKSFARKLNYPLSTVGAWMDTAIPYFTTDSSVDHCLDLVKRQKSHLGGVVIVVDNRRHLVGLVEVERLLTSDGGQKLAELLNTDIEALPTRATLWEVENHQGWTQFPTLPVIDHNNIMLGALTHSALRAGMIKSSHPSDKNLKFSLVAHMGKAFIVSLTGLLHVISGVSEIQEQTLPSPPPRTDNDMGGNS